MVFYNWALSYPIEWSVAVRGTGLLNFTQVISANTLVRIESEHTYYIIPVVWDFKRWVPALSF